MKDINMQLSYKIQPALKSLDENIVSYFEECCSNIEKLDLK